MNWVNARLVILGVARQGIALARYAAARGARVTLSDARPATELAAELAALADLPIRYALGGHPAVLLDDCDLLCLSGGVPIDLPIIREAQQRGIPLSNDAQIFLEECPAPIIGITGSAGKTTTTTLTGEMMKLAYRDDPQVSVWVGGNIGNPLISDVQHMGALDRVVMELSSFQLELMTRSPHIACITNITPNHLDRHVTMQAYIAAKRHILDSQTADDWRVLGADDSETAKLGMPRNTIWFSVSAEPAGDAAWLDNDGQLRLRLSIAEIDNSICHRRELLLMGKHNVLNVLAASALAALSGAPLSAIREVATTFVGVAHRLQLVREVGGVRYYDDSIATAPERMMAALRCFHQPVVLLCGGRDKHLPWAEAVQLMEQRCRHVVLFGEMTPLVLEEMQRQQATVSVTSCDTLERAVRAASDIGQAGDVVLLSPGGTSYDAYKDFAERGDMFVTYVRQLEDRMLKGEVM